MIGKETESLEIRKIYIEEDFVNKNIKAIRNTLNILIIKRTAKSKIINGNEALIILPLY